MEHLWSPAGATSGNRSQVGRARKRLKQADRQRVATHGNGFGAHGKEGVDGSSPSEGLSGTRKSLQKAAFCCRDGHCGPPPLQGGDRRYGRSGKLGELLEITTFGRASGHTAKTGDRFWGLITGSEPNEFARACNVAPNRRRSRTFVRAATQARGLSRSRRSYTRDMTRDEFNARLKRDGGFRVVVRLLREDEGGRKTGLSGESE
jgi:hypothetical protein